MTMGEWLYTLAASCLVVVMVLAVGGALIIRW